MLVHPTLHGMLTLYIAHTQCTAEASHVVWEGRAYTHNWPTGRRRSQFDAQFSDQLRTTDFFGYRPLRSILWLDISTSTRTTLSRE